MLAFWQWTITCPDPVMPVVITTACLATCWPQMITDHHRSSRLRSVLIRVHPWLTSVRNTGLELSLLHWCPLMHSRVPLFTSSGLRTGVPPEVCRPGSVQNRYDSEPPKRRSPRRRMPDSDRTQTAAITMRCTGACSVPRRGGWLRHFTAPPLHYARPVIVGVIAAKLP